MMRTSTEGLKKIGEFEGLRLRAYRCPAGVWTVGYGHTGLDVNEGTVVTEERAMELLRADAAKAESAVRSVGVMRQNEFDALVSLVFNIGIGAFRGSTLRKRLVEGAPLERLREAWLMWKYSGGKPNLQRRREAEFEMYAKGRSILESMDEPVFDLPTVLSESRSWHRRLAEAIVSGMGYENIINYQLQHGLIPDGIVGRVTWTHIIGQLEGS